MPTKTDSNTADTPGTNLNPAEKRSAAKTGSQKAPVTTIATPKKVTKKKTVASKKVSKKTPAPKAATRESNLTKPHSRAKPARPAFDLAGRKVAAGKRMRIELPIANLMSGTPVALPLIVVHGKKDGPVVWLSAAIHGDEIGGVEIIRQVMDVLNAPSMSGTVIAAPVVNVHGFNTNDRYLPDRRDLNRSFPGSLRGSLASRIAALFMNEVVKRSDVGIDLHTGSDLRTNLPQIRCNLDHMPTRELAEIFGPPIVIDAHLRDGSLRQAAVEEDKIMLLFEGGEASRFDPTAIATGVSGVLRVLRHLGVIDTDTPAAPQCLYSRSTGWSRASRSGIVHLDAHLGELVTAKQQVATIYDPFGKRLSRITAKNDGIVIGHTQAPLVNRGDAISHIARITPEAPTPSWDTPGAVDTEVF
jgi:predicted deacylase